MCSKGPFELGHVKKIEAIIKPFKLEEVRIALCQEGVEGMTIIEVRGFGQQRGQTQLFRSVSAAAEFMPKVKLEIVVPDERVSRVVNVIADSARTGKIGDGKIFVYNIERAVRIRTHEEGSKAV